MYMLERIVNRQPDALVLGFFMVAPERAYSPLEIGRRLGVSEDRAAASLRRLVGEGYLKGFSKKGKRYFLVNAKHALLPQMRAYFSKNGPKYQDELFVAIRKLGDVRAAYLSGIFTAQPTLPVDILLVGKVNLPKLTFFLKHLEKMMGQEINYSIMTPDEFQIRRNTFDKFIKDIFDYRHVVVFEELHKKKSKTA